MDKQIKKRLKLDITIFPCSGTVDGDKQFGDPVVLKGFSVPKYVVITTREGEQVQCNTSVILDATDLPNVKDSDEIELPFISRRPIRSVQPYLALSQGYELVEVLI